MRISDWSSDVCSSDLIFVVSSHAAGPGHHLQVHHIINDYQKILLTIDFSPGTDTTYLRIKTRRKGFCSLQEHIAVGGIPRQPKGISEKIGRASCRERVCQYV